MHASYNSMAKAVCQVTVLSLQHVKPFMKLDYFVRCKDMQLFIDRRPMSGTQT